MRGVGLRCGTADLLEVYDVKEQLGSPHKVDRPYRFLGATSDSRSRHTYCTTRANFEKQRRTAIVENFYEILVSHEVINRAHKGHHRVQNIEKLAIK